MVAGFVILETLWPADLSRLPLHLLLALGGAWALARGNRAGGAAFGGHDSPTKFLALPMLIGIGLAILDLWNLIADT